MEGTRDDYDDTTDAAQAFDELRAEVAVMRRAVEALPGAWEAHRPPDYSPDLGHIAHGLAAVVDQLDAMHQLPALRMTPDQYSQAVSEAISQAGHGLKLGLCRDNGGKARQGNSAMTRSPYATNE